MAKKQDKDIVLAGRNIYIDDHDRYVYYSKSTNTGHIIKQIDAKEYLTYSKRFFFGLLAGIVIYAFLENLMIAAVIGIATYAVLEYRFRSKFLPRLPEVKNFVPERHLKRIEVIASDEVKRLLLKAFLFIALAVLLPLRAMEMNAEGLNLYLFYIIAVGAVIYAIIHLYAIYYKKQNPYVEHLLETKSKAKNRKTTR